jgi:hypothetical protein
VAHIGEKLRAQPRRFERRIARHHQILTRSPAIDRIEHGANQHVRFEGALDQVVFGAVLDGIRDYRRIVQSRQRDDRDLRYLPVHLRDGLAPLPVGQRKVKQDEVEAARAQPLEAAVETIGSLDFEARSIGRAQALTQQPLVERVVLDQQQTDRFAIAPNWRWRWRRILFGMRLQFVSPCLVRRFATRP